MSKKQAVNPKIRQLISSVEHDTDALMALDDFYTDLFGLIMCYDPDPNYLGIEDKATLKDLLAKTIKKFSPEQQDILKQEKDALERLLKEGKYGHARNHVLPASQLIMDYLADGREPPTGLKKVLGLTQERHPVPK